MRTLSIINDYSTFSAVCRQNLLISSAGKFFYRNFGGVPPLAGVCGRAVRESIGAAEGCASVHKKSFLWKNFKKQATVCLFFTVYCIYKKYEHMFIFF